MKHIAIVFFLFTSVAVQSQNLFPDKCIGTWKGTMMIYGRGVLRDSVKVTLTVKTSDTPNEWMWRTEYHSEKTPMTKNYTLRLTDALKNIYITDEHNGIELYDYQFGNKLYNMFETQGIYLTSSYELMGDKLVFEVTSGKKTEATGQDVTNFSVDNLQRVVFQKTN